MKDDNLERYYIPLFLYWLIILLILFFTSCSQKSVVGLNTEGKVIGKYDGNVVAVRFYIKGEKYYVYDFFYVEDTSVNVGHKAKIVFEK